ncbi:MAG: 50S ribosomal protein L23 [Candidatus Paceibacterota bacterium]|jgi:large subunit ribosomal protein L23
MALFAKKQSDQKEKQSPSSVTHAIQPHAVILQVQRPHLTEKALKLSEKNQYVFRVDNAASKNEIKKQIKKLYHVDVLKVRVIVGEEKQRRLRGIASTKSLVKKMIVTIKEGQKIDLGVR